MPFFGKEIATEQEWLAKHMQKAWSTGLGVNLFGMSRGAQAHLAAGPCGDRIEHGVLPLPIQKIASRNTVAAALDLGPHHHDAVGLVVGQWREQRGVDDAENRGVRADAQGQRQYRDRREAGILPQQPQAKEQVAPAISHEVSLAARESTPCQCGLRRRRKVRSLA